MIECMYCGEKKAKSVPTTASFKLFGGTKVYDPKDAWEDTPLAGMGEPSLAAKENYKPKTVQLDLGQHVEIGAGRTQQKPGRQWEQAQEAVRTAAKENLGVA